MTNLIKDILQEIIEVQNSVKINDLNHSSTKKELYIYERRQSIDDACKEQSIFYNKMKRTKHGKIPDEKNIFLQTF